MTKRISILLMCAAGCGGSGEATTAHFDLAGATSSRDTYFHLPFPSDLRLTAEGMPDLEGYPSRDAALFNGLKVIAEQRPGWPVMPTAYFQFSDVLPPLNEIDALFVGPTAPIVLINVDEQSSARGTTTPVVARTLVADESGVPSHVLAIAPRPGFVLLPHTRYAFVVMRGLLDAEGNELGVPDALATLANGGTPDGARGAQARELYAPLWETLAELSLDSSDVAAATVFTTGDVVEDLYTMTEAIRAQRSVTISNIHLDPDDGATHPRFCELHATIAMPQYQQGDAPFDTEGLFELDSEGVPIEQKVVDIPVVIAVPKKLMPAAGYPLTMYFHGSGGLSTEMVDRGKILEPGGDTVKGEGPTHVLAWHGIATAGAALPVNPERVPGASEQEYLNFANLAAFRDTFRQGIVESRLFLDALLELQLTPEQLAGCSGPELPEGVAAFRFDADNFMAQGQSMGGMYTNLFSAVEPRVKAAVPTGAGGYWNYFILETSLVPGAKSLLSVLIRADEEELTFMHPTMSLLGMAWEHAEPMAYMPRIGRRPLEGHPARHIYEPVAPFDRYFPMSVYDAVVLAYGHPQVGAPIWTSMQDVLQLAGLQGFISYPVNGNITSATGDTFTGAVVQYEGDGIGDPHGIYGQLDEVKYQYGCFQASAVRDGVPTVFEPAALETPCPDL